MEAAPRSVNYADTLPLAIASTQNRRSYFPQNGQSFSDSGSSIIRIDVQADGLLDVQQSYLEFTLKDTAGNGIRALDQGHVWIKRLTIESGGVILEDINNYNRLVAGILQPAQGSAAYTGEIQLSQGGACQQNVTTGIGALATGEPSVMNALVGLTDGTTAGAEPTPDADGSNGLNIIPAGGTFTGQYHLVCGLLNMDKYLPLVLMGQGFTIQIELASGNEIGIQATGNGVHTYEISNVKYVAHIVDMARDFYDMLRNLQQASGGSLMLGSSTYRHFTHTFEPGSGVENINISARVRSLENLLFVGNESANLTDATIYSLSTGSCLGMDDGSYNVFVGAVRYPQNRIAVNRINNKGQAYQELRKCFGALGSINHGGLLNSATYLANSTGSGVDGTITGGFGACPTYAPFGISFRSWRHELEDGIDTSSKSLPIRLELNTNTDGFATTVDIYAQATILFYVNMDGSVSASV